MKKVSALLFSLLLIFSFSSCKDDEDDDDVQPIVFPTEDKGEAITFSSSSKAVFVNSLDTFVVIKGGVPPYVVKDFDVSIAFISNDTLFFSEFNNGFPRLKTITVSDNRSFNQSQFNFISSPRFINLRIDFNRVFDYQVSDGMGNSFLDFDFFSGFSYDIVEDEFSVGNFMPQSKLNFEIKNLNGSQTIEDLNYLFVDQQQGVSYPYLQDATAVQNINVETSLLGIPKSIEFDLNVSQTNTTNAPSQLNINSRGKFNLFIN